MAKVPHTAGPWLAAAAVSSIVGLPVVAQSGRLIANVNCASDPIHGKVPGDDAFNREALANAQLIAAAPKLRIALQTLVDAIYADVDLAAHRQIARLIVDAETALRDAEGRS